MKKHDNRKRSILKECPPCALTSPLGALAEEASSAERYELLAEMAETSSARNVGRRLNLSEYDKSKQPLDDLIHTIRPGDALNAKVVLLSEQLSSSKDKQLPASVVIVDASSTDHRRSMTTTSSPVSNDSHVFTQIDNKEQLVPCAQTLYNQLLPIKLSLSSNESESKGSPSSPSNPNSLYRDEEHEVSIEERRRKLIEQIDHIMATNSSQMRTLVNVSERVAQLAKLYYN